MKTGKLKFEYVYIVSFKIIINLKDKYIEIRQKCQKWKKKELAEKRDLIEHV